MAQYSTVYHKTLLSTGQHNDFMRLQVGSYTISHSHLAIQKDRTQSIIYVSDDCFPTSNFLQGLWVKQCSKYLEIISWHENCPGLRVQKSWNSESSDSISRSRRDSDRQQMIFGPGAEKIGTENLVHVRKEGKKQRLKTHFQTKFLRLRFDQISQKVAVVFQCKIVEKCLLYNIDFEHKEPKIRGKIGLITRHKSHLKICNRTLTSWAGTFYVFQNSFSVFDFKIHLRTAQWVNFMAFYHGKVSFTQNWGDWFKVQSSFRKWPFREDSNALDAFWCRFGNYKFKFAVRVAERKKYFQKLQQHLTFQFHLNKSCFLQTWTLLLMRQVMAAKFISLNWKIAWYAGKF